MDKLTMKKIFGHHGLPQVEWLGFTRKDWEGDGNGWVRRVEAALGYPCFVKPANLGSSVGIGKATDAGELERALGEAAALDRRLIVEAGVDAREIEVSVLGNERAEVSVPGEILVKKNEFYDYEAKYAEGGMELLVPADVTDEVASEIRRIARAAYEAVDAAGMARVDFFLERDTGRLLLNEINTIPGFTPTSVYARLWTATGLPTKISWIARSSSPSTATGSKGRGARGAPARWSFFRGATCARPGYWRPCLRAAGSWT